VSLDGVPNRDDLALTCDVGGERMQTARSSDMVFSVSQLIAYLSKFCTLEPGDIIFTGTPDGVGSGQQPRRYLKGAKRSSAPSNPSGRCGIAASETEHMNDAGENGVCVRRKGRMATPVEQWVEQVAAHTKPDRIVWCDGSAEENQRLIEEMLASGTLEQLNEAKYPNSYLHRSDPSDVARPST
jgi:hypothetical protein